MTTPSTSARTACWSSASAQAAGLPLVGTARVHTDYDTLKAMADAGARLLIVGFESGDAQILKNIKKGATAGNGRAVS